MGVCVLVVVCEGVAVWEAVSVIEIVFDRLSLDVIVVVLDCAGAAETVLEAEIDPDTDSDAETFADLVTVYDINGVPVFFNEPVPDTETVEVLLLVILFVLVGVTRGLGEPDDEPVSVFETLAEAECVDDTEAVFVPVIVLVEQEEAVPVLVDVTVAVCVGVF